MEKAVLLAVAASFCTATASVAQRQGASSVPTTGGFDVRLILRLARRPIWLLGIASMIAGFFFQLTALRYGALAPGPARSRARTASGLRIHGRRRPSASAD
jgi:hypothetical protein